MLGPVRCWGRCDAGVSEMPGPVRCRRSSEGAGPGVTPRGRSQAGPGGSGRSSGSMAEAEQDGVSGAAEPPRYRGALHPDTWEQELEAIPMFMKRCPAEIDAARQPELACLQSLLFDEEQSPAELARMYKNEGNEYFKEKDYGRAVAAYSEGLQRRCGDAELDAVLLTNRGAAHFHLGNYRSALNDAIQAKKLKPTHLKAIIRGALCHMELKNFSEAIAWCEEGLQIDSKEKKLVEMRAKADKLKRIQERDARKAKAMERKEQCQKEILLAAIKERNIKLVLEPSDEEEEVSDGLAEISLDGFHSDSAAGAKVHLDADGSLNWPVLFLYPEHEQTDFTVAFHENSRFIDHLMVMFAELPPWDLEKKYLPNNLELYFEDEEREEMYEVNPEHTLLQVLQHERYFVKAGTPTVLVFAKRSPFSKKYFSGKKVHRL
ncbi:tetratricopeptide repeat protein 4 [Corvus hawaiiensis]|uniref:tetratricopeptide repeat protein 4 n=1 Tax=Corvus hawaiiensis TaxID=134902 RepID=UPI002019C70B|nr:tetratricopeptide repeat protein 4 [Corvus hawaiiensis]